MVMDRHIFSIESFYPIGRIYAPLHLHREVHIYKVSDVAFGFILFQYWIFLFPFGYKSNKLFISQQRFHLFVFSKAKTSLSSSANCGLSLCETQLRLPTFRRTSLNRTHVNYVCSVY